MRFAQFMPALWGVAMLALAGAPLGATEAIGWHTDLQAAQREAAATGKFVLAHFWAPWCRPCMALEQNVFPDPQVAAAVRRDFVPVKLNVDEHRALAKELGVGPIPCDVVLTPQGQVLQRKVSPQASSAYAAAVTAMAQAAQHRGDTYMAVARQGQHGADDAHRAPEPEAAALASAYFASGNTPPFPGDPPAARPSAGPTAPTTQTFGNGPSGSTTASAHFAGSGSGDTALAGSGIAAVGIASSGIAGGGTAPAVAAGSPVPTTDAGVSGSGSSSLVGDRYANWSPTPERQPPAAAHQPPAAAYQPPVAAHQPPVAAYQPPAAAYQPPAVAYQPPATAGPAPATPVMPYDGRANGTSVAGQVPSHAGAAATAGSFPWSRPGPGQAPVAHAPGVPAPTAQQRIAQQPAAQHPIAQQPFAQQPVSHSPLLPQPHVQQPIVQQPPVQQPVAQQPVVPPVAQQLSVPPAAQQPMVPSAEVPTAIAGHAAQQPAPGASLYGHRPAGGAGVPATPAGPAAPVDARGAAPPAHAAAAAGQPAATSAAGSAAAPPAAAGTAAGVDAGIPQIPPGNPPLAFEGYCVVTMVERGVWQRGNIAWGARHRGRTYLFAGPQEQQRFLRDPDTYAPVLSGHDVVRYLEGRQLVAGDLRLGQFFEGRIYLFADRESVEKFQRNPEHYARPILQALLPTTRPQGASR
jgi:YHS domain-containing protein/thiol-disulfide isomerase/thioredoxin